MVITDLDCTLAHVGHMAIGAGDAATRVYALAPCLELRVLRLEKLGSSGCMSPVSMLGGLVVVRLDRVGLEAICPWIGQQFSVALEIVFDMALAANEAAHLLSRS